MIILYIQIVWWFNVIIKSILKITTISIIFILLCGCVGNGSNNITNKTNIDDVNAENIEYYIIPILRECGIGTGNVTAITKSDSKYMNISTIQYAPTNGENNINLEIGKKLSDLMKKDGWNETYISIASNGATITYEKGNKKLTIASNKYINYIQIQYVEKDIESINRINQQYIDTVRNGSSSAGTTAKSAATKINSSL